MSINSKSSLALLLIALGSLIILNKVGFHLHLMGYLVPIAMVGLGYLGILNGKKIGWLLAIIGGFILFVKLSGLVAIAFAVLLIGYGLSLIGKRKDTNIHDL
jgi:lia operon protein LiaI